MSVHTLLLKGFVIALQENYTADSCRAFNAIKNSTSVHCFMHAQQHILTIYLHCFCHNSHSAREKKKAKWYQCCRYQ